MISLYIQRTRRDKPPNEPIVFMVGRGGAYVCKRNHIFEATVRARMLPMLEDVREGARYLLPPMPTMVVASAIRFFREVWKRWKTEAILLIEYNRERRMFRLTAPRQRPSGGNCEYDPPLHHTDGFTVVGTIHSHGDMDAFHSGTDVHDEDRMDGIHVTVGHVDERCVEIVASLAVNGQRFRQEPERVCGGLVARSITEDVFQSRGSLCDRGFTITVNGKRISPLPVRTSKPKNVMVRRYSVRGMFHPSAEPPFAWFRQVRPQKILRRPLRPRDLSQVFASSAFEDLLFDFEVQSLDKKTQGLVQDEGVGKEDP